MIELKSTPLLPLAPTVIKFLVSNKDVIDAYSIIPLPVFLTSIWLLLSFNVKLDVSIKLPLIVWLPTNVLEPVVAYEPVFEINNWTSAAADPPNDDVATNVVLFCPFPTQTYPFAKDAVKLPKISISPLETISLVTKISLWKLASCVTNNSPNEPVPVNIIEPVVIESVVTICWTDSNDPDFLKNTLPS